MQNSELYRLVCQSLILDEYPELKQDIVEKLNAERTNVDRFIHLASNHFVLPAIYLKFQRAGILSVFPNDYRIHLEEIYKQNLQRNKQILGQIKEISLALAKENIHPVYLKGTANLMDGLYSDTGERMIGDIDFLVQEKDYFNTAAIMLDLGYKIDKPGYENPKELKDYPRMYREDIPADIEIHRVPVNLPFASEFTGPLLIQHKEKLQRHSNLFIPSTEHRLIHAFIHSQLSNKGHQLYTPGLRDMCDAWLLMQKIIDTDQIIEEIEEKKKADIFFEYVNYLFSRAQDFSQLENKATLKYIKGHRWLLDHPACYRLYISTYKLYELIFIRYLKRFFRALFSKKDLLYIYRRLKDPRWYRKHFRGVREQIVGK